MSRQGRFGKYGDRKRLDRLRNTGIRALPGGAALRNARPPYFGSGRISIRRARLSDMGFIGRLSEKVFRVYGPYGNLLPAWFESGLTITLVAVEKAAPIGFAMMGRIFEGPEKENPCELLAIAVEPCMHRRGVGGMLLRSIEKEAGKLGEPILFLHTAVDNLPARDLFKKHHFITVSLKRRFYSAGQDAVMMLKTL